MEGVEVHRPDRPYRPADFIGHSAGAGGRRAGRLDKRADRHQGAGQLRHRHAGHGHHHRRPQLRLFDGRRSSPACPAFLAYSLGRFWGIPNNVFVMAAVLVFLWIFGGAHLHRPGDPGGGRQSGGAAQRHQCGRVAKILGFVISGVCAALTGILLASAAAPPAPPTAICSPPSPPCSWARPPADRPVPCLWDLHRRAEIHRGRLHGG